MSIPREIRDLIFTMSALRESQRRAEGNEIRKLQALIDAGLASILPGLEAGQGVISEEAQAKGKLFVLADEGLKCLQAQARYFKTRGQQELREAKDRERRLNSMCREILADVPVTPSLFGLVPEKAGAA